MAFSMLSRVNGLAEKAIKGTLVRRVGNTMELVIPDIGPNTSVNWRASAQAPFKDIGKIYFLKE